MANSNLDKPRIQPFKCITLKMKQATDLSSPYTDVNTSNHAKVRKPGNNIYVPVIMDVADDKGDLLACTTNCTGVNYTKGDPIVGVLIESHRFPGVESQVMVQGIVPMEASGAISPGDLISVGSSDGTKHKVCKVTGTDDYAFGIALTKATNDGDWVAVLLGRGMKVKS